MQFLRAYFSILAISYGVHGIMVSNHGARQLDGVSATIDALEEIANIGTNHLLL